MGNLLERNSQVYQKYIYFNRLLEEELPVESLRSMVGNNEHMITLLGSLFGEELSFNDFFWLIVALSFLPIKYTYWLLFASCGIFPFGQLKRVYFLKYLLIERFTHIL